jgi:hypothetical protein
MNFKNYLSKRFLIEAALTKGSQRVMADKKLVSGIADAMRDDAFMHPQNFPAGAARQYQKAPDEELAQWFLEEIDKIEAEGYEGTVYSRDGVYSDWIARRYIAGSHNWEDIKGVMNMNMRDWTLLKNRNLLGANHRDIPKFNSVRDVGAYVNTHYEHHLKDIRDAAKAAALKKSMKSALIVDNDDYRVYTVFNRNAARTIGQGTQWCTANSNYAGHYENYSKSAMLFQLIPKEGETDEKGRINKYQFDAGGKDFGAPGGFSFKDVLDHQVQPKIVAEKFPYLYTDLVSELEAKKGPLEEAMVKMNDDPTLNKNPDSKTKVYDIDTEIAKLTKMKDAGYFTDNVRPKKKEEKPEDQEALPPAEPGAETPPPQGNEPMESFNRLVQEMLEGEIDPNMDDSSLRSGSITGSTPQDPLAFEIGDIIRDKYQANNLQVIRVTPNDSHWALSPKAGSLTVKDTKTGKEFDVAGANCKIVSKGNKGTTMENIDKDIAAMLNNLKKYDILKESYAPVIGMVSLGKNRIDELSTDTVKSYKDKADPWNRDKKGDAADATKRYAKGQAAADKRLQEEDEEVDEEEELDEGGKPPWLEKAEKKAEKKEGKDTDDDDEKEELDERDEGKHNNGKTTGFKTVAKKAAAEYGSKEAGERVAGAVRNKMKAAGKLEEDTGPDPEVIAWMKRFDKLGRL